MNTLDEILLKRLGKIINNIVLSSSPKKKKKKREENTMVIDYKYALTVVLCLSYNLC